MRIRGLTIEWISIRKKFSVTPNVYGFMRHDARMKLSMPLAREVHIIRKDTKTFSVVQNCVHC